MCCSVFNGSGVCSTFNDDSFGWSTDFWPVGVAMGVGVVVVVPRITTICEEDPKLASFSSMSHLGKMAFVDVEPLLRCVDG